VRWHRAGFRCLGTAPVEGRISGIVDIPNACCTQAIPTEIFEFDIHPNAKGPTKMVSGAGEDASEPPLRIFEPISPG
jgi:hypothetical protein